MLNDLLILKIGRTINCSALKELTCKVELVYVNLREIKCIANGTV